KVPHERVLEPERGPGLGGVDEGEPPGCACTEVVDPAARLQPRMRLLDQVGEACRDPSAARTPARSSTIIASIACCAVQVSMPTVLGLRPSVLTFPPRRPGR